MNTKNPIRTMRILFILFLFVIWVFFNTKITLSDYIWKTENRTKNTIYVKDERQVNSNLLCKFGHFWWNLNFWGAVWACLGACGSQMRYDMMWYKILYPSFFKAHYTSFMLRWLLLREGFCISLVGKHSHDYQKFTSFEQKRFNPLYKFQWS